MTGRTDGIDVSHWQGDIDWRAVLQELGGGALPRWLAAKATEGVRYVDPTFHAHRRELRFLAQPADVLLWYHWLDHATPADDQARHYLATVGELDVGEGVMLDVEEDGVTEAAALEWCRIVEAATGRPVAIYTGAYVAGGTVWKSPRLFDGRRPRVFAAYTTEPKAKAHAAPFEWDVWQWTGKGRITGIATDVDIDQVDDWAIFAPVVGRTTEGDQPMSNLFTVNDGDVAVFAATAGMARWLPSWADIATLQALGQLPKITPAQVPQISRAELGTFELVGPAPEYPADYAGPRTYASHFR